MADEATNEVPQEQESESESTEAQEPQTFTQDDVNRIVQDRLKRLGDVSELKRKAEEYDKLAESQKSELQREVDRAIKATRQEMTAQLNERLIASEVRVAAATKLNDPEDAVRFLDLKNFEVDESGTVDSKAISQAIEKLVESKPYLAANGKRQIADFDAGPRTPAPSGEHAMNELLRRGVGR